MSSKAKNSILLVGLFFALLPSPLFAADEPFKPTEYELLAPIPQLTVRTDGSECVSENGQPCATTDSFIPGLFRLAIALATGLAVLMLIYGGIQYMSTDAWGEKNEAKGTIWNAIMGLLLTLSAWLIIYTINPNLVEFNLEIGRVEIKPTVPLTAVPGGVVAGSCPNCVVISVPHKPAPNGCAAPGPCTVNGGLNAKLLALHALQPLRVTEGFPPTRTHKNPCHSTGTCVDATITAANEVNIKKFIENATSVGLNAQFETTTEKRAADIRAATGLSDKQVYFVAGITGEHFSIYNK